MKSILAIITGILAGLCITLLGYMVFSSMYPYPTGYEVGDRAAYQTFVDTWPRGAYITKILSNISTIFTTGLTGAIIGRSMRFQSAIIATLPFFIYFVVTDFTFVFPTYYVVLDITLMVLFAFASIAYGSSRVISEK